MSNVDTEVFVSSPEEEEAEEDDNEIDDLAMVDPSTEALIEALDEVRDHLMVHDGRRLNAKAQEVFDSVLRNHRSRIQAGLVTIAIHRFGQIAALTKAMGDIEAELARRVKSNQLKVTGTKDLAILYRALADREKNLIAFAADISHGGMPEKLEETLDMRDIQEDLERRGVQGGVPEPESRERVTRILEMLAKKASSR